MGRRGRRDVIQSDGSCNIEAAATNGKEKVTESLPLGGGREAHVERDDGGGRAGVGDMSHFSELKRDSKVIDGGRERVDEELHHCLAV